MAKEAVKVGQQLEMREGSMQLSAGTSLPGVELSHAATATSATSPRMMLYAGL